MEIGQGRGKDSLTAGKYLGDFVIRQETFAGLDELFSLFASDKFSALSDNQKIDRVNEELYRLIQKVERPTFLLIPVLDFVERINKEKILENYSFTSFEIWLNQFSHLSAEENYGTRSAIVGKYIPRESYQLIFPISMGKMYPGTHYVTAHQSPDLDTTIASFWGWMDAFGARVSEGNHLWNVPGGPPYSQVEIALLFQQIFGESVFVHLAKTRTALAVRSIDLMTQRGVIKKKTNESMLMIDHERNQNAIVLIDEGGNFLGDWRPFDVEGVRQVVEQLNNCLRWFENSLHAKLISLFALEGLSLKDLPAFIRSILGTRIGDCKPAKAFTGKQKTLVEDFLIKVMEVPKGLESTFEEFAISMKAFSLFEFQEFMETIESLTKSDLFDKSGKLIENRPRIFHYLQKIILGLDKAIQSVGIYEERLDVALQIKTKVFGYPPQVISHRAEVDEMRSKMGSYPYLTVTYNTSSGNKIPLGVVHASEVHRPILGTVTLRDFCNREETKVPPYLEVISVIDHHKSVLQTSSPPVATISDAQSSNALVAKIAFEINDAYSSGGMTLSQVKEQIEEVKKDLSTFGNKRILQRLLQRQMNLETKSSFFIDPKREFIEYLHFFYAILDDTDLLTKVSVRDVECAASLLNRMKSLLMKKEVEVVHFDDLKRDEQFIKLAVNRIMQNSETYSLYSKIYLAKENAIDHNLKLCIEKKPSTIFADTKIQNGCCRVGQSKMFAKNFSIFFKHADAIRESWLEESQLCYRERSEIDFYLQMISTIAGAEDLFAGTVGQYPHKDEIWIWIPDAEQAVVHLKSFLNAFKGLPGIGSNDFEIEFLGSNAKELEEIFKEAFLPVPVKSISKNLPLAVLRFKAGTLNSRKAMISPFLPKLF